MNKRAQEWLKSAPTETLQRIADSAPSRARQDDTVNFPLASRIHVEGYGEVDHSAIRGELRDRSLANAS